MKYELILKYWGYPEDDMGVFFELYQNDKLVGRTPWYESRELYEFKEIMEDFIDGLRQWENQFGIKFDIMGEIYEWKVK